MKIFNRRYEKIEDEIKNKETRKEGFKKLKEENLKWRDVLALIVALFQLVIPFAIIIVVAYFLIILFITQIWWR